MAKAGGLCACDLDNQNARYAGTGGVSFNNRQAGFSPAYLNTDTGEMVVSCFADGSPAPVHVLDGLPGDWVAVRGDDGGVSAAVSSVVAGFTRHGVFYTRADAQAGVWWRSRCGVHAVWSRLIPRFPADGRQFGPESGQVLRPPAAVDARRAP